VVPFLQRTLGIILSAASRLLALQTQSSLGSGWATLFCRHVFEFRLVCRGSFKSVVVHLPPIYLCLSVCLSVSLSLTKAYGTSVVNKDTWIQRFRQHNTAVVSAIPPNQLLTIDFTKHHGWVRLCSFLNHTHGPCQHPSSTEFVHENARITHQHAGNTSETGMQYIPLDCHPPRSPGAPLYAYATLLAFPSVPERRDYLISAIVAIQSIRNTNTTYDIIVMVFGGLSRRDEQLLVSEHVKVNRYSFCPW
jgi:hypothetical protein